MAVLTGISLYKGPPLLVRQTDQSAFAPQGEKLDYNLIVHRPRPRIGGMVRLGPPILLRQMDTAAFQVELVPTEDTTIDWPYRRVIGARNLHIMEAMRNRRRNRR